MGCYCPCSHWRGNHSLNPLPHLVQILSAQLKSPDLEETRGYVKATHQVALLSALARILHGLNQLFQIFTSHLKLLFSYYTRLSITFPLPDDRLLFLTSFGFRGKAVPPG